MTESEHELLLEAIVAIGTKLIAIKADPRIWDDDDQCSLCRSVFQLASAVTSRKRRRKAYKDRKSLRSHEP